MKLSKVSLQKLQLFCSCANKSTGIGHPCDEMRWFDFVCQTVIENNIIDTYALEEILQDEMYLGEGNTWSEQWARRLAVKYENACRILQYYRKMQ